MTSLGLRAYAASKQSDRGDHNEYKFEVGRLLSFKTWPSASISASPTRLAKAGLFYMGRGDEVRCYSCNVLIKDWEIRDNPFQKHSALSPNCLHILGQDENNVPITASTVDETTSSTKPISAVADALGSRRPLSSLTQFTTQSRSQPRSTGLDEPDNAATNNTTPISRQSSRPVPLQSHLNHQDSSHTDSMRDELTRLATFQRRLYRRDADERKVERSGFLKIEISIIFPTTCPVRPADLARAGFFYVNVDDMVKCAFCDGMIRNWERGDRAFDEHARHFPNCSFVQQSQRNIESNNRPHFSSSNFSYNLDRGVSTQNNVTRNSQSSVPGSENGSRGFQRGIILDNLIEDNPIVTDRPKHPEYALEQNRINTFRTWPIDKKQTPRELATSGFFYAGFGDNVKCFFCSGGLRNWEPQDDVWTEHARWFPRCGFVKQCKGVAFIRGVAQQNTNNGSSFHVEAREIKARLDTPSAQKVIEMGYSRDLVRKTIEKRLRTTGDDFPNLQTFIEALLDIEEEEKRAAQNSQQNESIGASANQTSNQNSAKNKKKTEKPKNVSAKAQNKEKESPATADKIRKENAELKDQRMCKVCMDDDSSVVLLPCAHLVCCTTCAPALSNCPICRSAIRGTVKAFLA
ncbi:baculoviral IAP repeat-containing protein 7-like [Lingula anatina]|uniref:Baculoviral IAP repeat-containing protein 7-like n=1 Tax=Lingula anatina TaxID=7574 RepID=A0A1S3I775_LINAN|nr:baculoviral IAP repeat-containing protein 7-like [Lingula anatina]|eukprot:XP_013394130.1 baculoviral IAP repeat-containing protein 7-like [Lingula anatina]